MEKDTDGIYYWTLDGEWLTDDEGNRIKAQGENGKDGDPGTEGNDGADGNDGQDGKDGKDGKDGLNGNSIFEGISQDADYVYFVLSYEDNTVITVPKARALSLYFFSDSDIACTAGESMELGYTLVGYDEETTVTCLGEGDWRGEVNATEAGRGKIIVTAPDPMVDGKILVIASNGKGKTTTKMLTFIEGLLESASDFYQVDYQAQTLIVPVTTNLDYTVHIPEEARSWITLTPATRSAMRKEQCIFSLQEHRGSDNRLAAIEFCHNGSALQTITVKQTGIWRNDVIHFADPQVKEYFVSNPRTVCDIDKDGEISYEEAAMIRSGNLHDFPRTAKSFDEFQYFTAITSIGGRQDNTGTWHDGLFYRCQFESITLPESITTIEINAFAECTNLKTIHIPDNVTSIGAYSFDGCTSLTSIELPDHLTIIDDYTFRDCGSLTSISIPAQTETIGAGAFTYCTNLREVIFEEGIVDPHLGAILFKNGSPTLSVTFPATLTTFGNSFEMFYKFTGDLSVTFLSPIPPTVESYGIVGNIDTEKTKIYVPKTSLEAYKTADEWSLIEHIIYPIAE